MSLINRWAVATYVAIAVLCFAPAFFPEQQIAGTDYVTGGYYFLEFAIQRMGGGHLPKWVPYIFGGVPMYANPGGLFYPLRLLFSAILPIERVMPAVYIVQFALAGVGMHLFARTLGARPWVALVAGVMFQLTGITFSYVYAGHDGRIIGATLTPLVFYFVTRGVRSGQTRWFVGLAATIGCIMLSFQLQSAYYVLLAGGAWAVFLLWRARGELATNAIAKRVGMGLAAVAFAFVLSAVNFLPFAGYVKDSPRSAAANRDYAFSTQFSMPPVETIGFAVPEQAGILEKYRGDNAFKLHTEYVGALAVLLLILGILNPRADRTWQFMAGLTVFALTICYGSYTPFYALYYKYLPGTDKFRSPSIALFLISFALVVMAALTLESLAAASDESEREKERNPRYVPPPRRLMTALTVLSGLAFVIALGTAMDAGDRAIGWLRFTLCFLLATLIVNFWTLGRMRTRTAAILLTVLTAGDLWLVDRHFFWTQPRAEMVYAEDDVVRFLRSQPAGRVWVFPLPDDPRYPHYMGNGRFGPKSDYLMRFGISQVGGEHGNELYRWNRLLGLSTTGTVDWHNLTSYAPILNAASVRYIISGIKLVTRDTTVKDVGNRSALREVYHGTAYVYENERAVPRAILVGAVRAFSTPEKVVIEMRTPEWDARKEALVEAEAAPFVSTETSDASAGTALVASDDPDRVAVRVKADRPAILVLSDNYADGWVAHVDGQETPILRTNLTYRGVPVAAGNHEVVFEFKPQAFYTGLWVSAAAALVLLLSIGAIFVIPQERA